MNRVELCMKIGKLLKDNIEDPGDMFGILESVKMSLFKNTMQNG